ncbi:peptidase inhibitor family I36 protein [Nonomuraea sp. NN258]|uniref:peptidase inhibitor family I36 protein n=1 Tax=Nonomuraea antri TaxID=2730852 RepID=UPI001568B7F8|nr:peptidase inhibitor family I36 protein [Nonomuraea antri]NRQ34483.1 peptidase inhibitor family I36 protein [Nonomuraea antri]
MVKRIIRIPLADRKGHTHMRRYSSIVVSLLVAATSLLASAPAQASAWVGACPVNYSCYYDGYDGTGSRWIAPTGGCHVPPAFTANTISSVWNRGHVNAYVHLYAKVGDTWETIASFQPGTRGNLPGSTNNNTDRVCITP